MNITQSDEKRSGRTIVDFRAERKDTIVTPDGRASTVLGDDDGTSTKRSQVMAVVLALDHIHEIVSEQSVAYKVKQRLAEAGESVLLLCEHPKTAEEVVCKIYYMPLSEDGISAQEEERRSKIRAFTTSAQAKSFVTPIVDDGVLFVTDSVSVTRKYMFDILPYYPQSDMSRSNHHFSFEQICEVTHQLNEALHAIHEAGFIHLDIKPSNLYYINGTVLIGDFGVAKTQQNGVRFTHTFAGTSGYMPPEISMAMQVRSAAITAAVDYYALAPTLASLRIGQDIWENHHDQIVECAQRGRLPVPRQTDDDIRFDALLSGLFQMQKDRRWGYEQVKKWLNNHDYTTEEEGTGQGAQKWLRAFKFLNTSYTDEQALFNAFAANWEEAKERLYQKDVEHFFKAFDSDISHASREIVEVTYPSDADMGLFVFLKQLYPYGAIVWRGRRWNGLSDLAQQALQDIGIKDDCKSLLMHQAISLWLKKTKGIAPDRELLDTMHRQEQLAAQSPDVACFWFCAKFAQADIEDFSFDFLGKSVSKLSELSLALLYNTEQFYKMVEDLRADNVEATCQLTGYLCAQGYEKQITAFRQRLPACDSKTIALELLLLLEEVAQREMDESTVEAIQNFNDSFGPYSYLNWWQDAVQSDTVYRPMTDEAKLQISRIKKYHLLHGAAVKEATQDLLAFQSEYDAFCVILQNNMLLSCAGILDGKQILVQSLLGLIDFDFLDRMAPNGFETHLKQEMLHAPIQNG